MRLRTELPAGLTDSYGAEAWEYQVVVADLISRASRWGYDLLRLNPLEYEGSFSSGVVGLSPWPEWNPNNCFRLSVTDFDSNYVGQGYHPMVLIPEGTISVARWLAEAVSSGLLMRSGQPYKIMYECPCFRNEPLGMLSARKLRKFDQFGCEIVGSTTSHADLEIMLLAATLLSSFGLDSAKALVRVGNVELFNTLSARTNFSKGAAVEAKEFLDHIAESRAARKNIHDSVNCLLTLVSKHCSGNESLLDAWRWVASSEFSPQMGLSFDIPYVPWELSRNSVQKVTMICGYLRSLGINAIPDLAVVRSHEYYTGIVFEMDYVDGDTISVEIAGGGRYDRLLDPFLNEAIGPLPSTGFAFGLQRVLALASTLSASPSASVNLSRPVKQGSMERTDDPAADYAKRSLLEKSSINEVCEIYLGDDPRLRHQK